MTRQHRAPFQHLTERRSVIKRLLWIGIAACVLSACSTLPPPPSSAPEAQWARTSEALRSIDSWEILGKVSIRTPSKRYTAAIHRWLQVDDFYTIDLSSTFFGMGASKIYGNAHHVTLYEAGELPASSNEPNELIEDALGMPLPISQLSYWIKALPAPHRDFRQTFNKAGQPHQLEQFGWTIEYSRYEFQGNYPLPKKIKLTRDNTTILLAIAQWTLN